MNTLCFWSGGKDSTASIILAHIHHLPITEIVFCEVMFDKSRNISGEIPEHIDFITNNPIPKNEQSRNNKKILQAESHKNEIKKQTQRYQDANNNPLCGQYSVSNIYKQYHRQARS